MSKRSSLDACGPNENGATARGASAVAFTNSRRLIVLMGAPPQTKLLRLLHYFLDAGSEIFQHDRRCVSTRPPGHRSTGMRRGSCLKKPGARHPMRPPPSRWSHRAGRRGARPARVTTAVQVVRVHAFQIKGALNDPRKIFVFRKIGREPPQKFQI